MMRNYRCRIFMLPAIILLAFALPAFGGHEVRGVGFEQVYGVMDLRTTFSDGALTVDQLVDLARQRKLQAVFINDHDRMIMSYGLPPFRNLLKRSVEYPSIGTAGPERFLAAIAEIRKKYPDMIVIPGTETTPYYYWSGNPFDGSLTAHDHEKRILTVGLESAEDYRQMPILHHKGTLNETQFGDILLFLGALFVSTVLIFWPGLLRWIGTVGVITALLFLLDADPFRTSPYDPYMGDLGIEPYQKFIDYVGERGGMTFWNYPETASGVRKLGPIQVNTKPYPGVLVTARGYTGFAAIYGDNITVTEPGNLWDIALQEYCSGYRLWPPWGIATADYHREGEDGNKLGNYQTVFLVRQRTQAEILKALQTGKMYASQGNYPWLPRLEEFSVSSAKEPEKKGYSGDDVTLAAPPRIRIALSADNPEKFGRVTVRLIRSGFPVATFEGPLPMVIDHTDTVEDKGAKIYYRMDMRGAGKIVSNPIFVTFAR